MSTTISMIKGSTFINKNERMKHELNRRL